VLQPGDLVCVTRAAIGVPLDSIGLITAQHVTGHRPHIKIYTVHLIGTATPTERRYLARDLKRVVQ
jgi:hypothetical protein